MSEDSTGDEGTDFVDEPEAKVEGLLYLVDQPEDKDGVTVLGASKLEPIRPSKPKMRKLTQEDVKSFQDHAEATVAHDNQWMSETSDVSAGGPAQVAKKLPIGLLIIPVVLFAILGCVAGWWMLYRTNPQVAAGAADIPEAFQRLSALERAAETKEERLGAAEFYEELEEVIARYFAAVKPSDFKGIIRDEERVMPLIREYYQTHVFEPKRFKSIDAFQPVSVEKRSMMGMIVQFYDGESNLALAEDAEDRVLVDWEAERAYQPIAITDFIRERPTKAYDLRVYAEPDNFYAFEFSDDKKYLSLKITFRNSEEYLYGYLERGGELEVKFRQMMKERGYNNSPMILRLRFPENGRGPRAVEVEEIVSKMWTLVDQSG